jgi:hypothetical protein
LYSVGVPEPLETAPVIDRAETPDKQDRVQSSDQPETIARAIL